MVTTSDDQSWFWTHEWQEMEFEADLDIASGLVHVTSSVEEFLNSLDV
jgi:hypothetical protein